MKEETMRKILWILAAAGAGLVLAAALFAEENRLEDLGESIK
jgi:hypothetical protein